MSTSQPAGVSFEAAAARLVELESRYKNAQSVAKEIYKEKNALSSSLLEYMEKNGEEKRSTPQYNFKVANSIEQKPLTMKLLQECFAVQFSNRPDLATSLYDKVAEYRRSNGRERTRLKTTKRRKVVAEV